MLSPQANCPADDIYMECFNPRHGIRIHTKGSVKDFLICFECSHLHIYESPTTEKYTRLPLKTTTKGNFLNKILNIPN